MGKRVVLGRHLYDLILLLVLAGSCIAGIVAAGLTDSAARGAVVTIGVPLAYLGLTERWRRAVGREVPASTEGAGKVLVAFLAALGVVVAGTYFHVLWAVLVYGLTTAALGWKHRAGRDARSGLALLGVFLTLYGVLGMIAQRLSR